jgi:hypothetical protein
MTIIDDPPLVGSGGGGRIAVTFSPMASVMVRVMAARLRVPIPELVRRAVGLFRMWMMLPKGSRLAIVDAKGNITFLKGPEYAAPESD